MDLPIILKDYYQQGMNNADRNINNVLRHVLSIIPDKNIRDMIITDINNEYDEINQKLFFNAPEMRVPKYWSWLGEILNNHLEKYRDEIWVKNTIKIWNGQ
jgi:hypothetical protein